MNLWPRHVIHLGQSYNSVTPQFRQRWSSLQTRTTCCVSLPYSNHSTTCYWQFITNVQHSLRVCKQSWVPTWFGGFLSPGIPTQISSWWSGWRGKIKNRRIVLREKKESQDRLTWFRFFLQIYTFLAIPTARLQVFNSLIARNSIQRIPHGTDKKGQADFAMAIILRPVVMHQSHNLLLKREQSYHLGVMKPSHQQISYHNNTQLHCTRYLYFVMTWSAARLHALAWVREQAKVGPFVHRCSWIYTAGGNPALC